MLKNVPQGKDKKTRWNLGMKRMENTRNGKYFYQYAGKLSGTFMYNRYRQTIGYLKQKY